MSSYSVIMFKGIHKKYAFIALTGSCRELTDSFALKFFPTEVMSISTLWMLFCFQMLED
jgi:hypothetical protein